MLVEDKEEDLEREDSREKREEKLKVLGASKKSSIVSPYD